jgi:TatD DNase family protein
VTWIDVHTHINMLEADANLVVQESLAAGVERLITIGTGHDDLPMVVKMAEELKPHVFGTLGFHPHDAQTFNQEGEDFLLANLDHPRIVGVGEIGLDYYYKHSDIEVQKRVFRRQLEIAAQKQLPVEIHTRDADEDTVAILREFEGQVRGLFHCFTGTQWLADQALALGFNISISGVVTFKNADALREVVKTVPLDRLHVETDSPFLTPVPFRGKKNAPAMMVHTAKVVAELKGISLEELSRRTKDNALNLFTKLNW